MFTPRVLFHTHSRTTWSWVLTISAITRLKRLLFTNANHRPQTLSSTRWSRSGTYAPRVTPKIARSRTKERRHRPHATRSSSFRGISQLCAIKTVPEITGHAIDAAARHVERRRSRIGLPGWFEATRSGHHTVRSRCCLRAILALYYRTVPSSSKQRKSLMQSFDVLAQASHYLVFAGRKICTLHA